MSSYEDVYGMAASLFEALKNIQWRSPRHWELDSIIDPVAEQLMLKLSQPQTFVANPTLAAPTNIRHFLRNIFSSIEDPIQLITFLTFLIVVPIFSTFLVAMLTNVNIVLRGLGLPLARNPIRASPLAVILFMVTVFGNIPLVSFFPAQASRVQIYLPVQPGHYSGVIASVLNIVAYYEIFELGATITLELVQLLRHGRAQAIRLIQPASIAAWLLSIAGFALRMWFTRVSSDTATSFIQSGSTNWVWRKIILRTDIRYQTRAQTLDDISIWLFYFVPAYLLSSLLAKFLLTPNQEAYRSVEPIIVKVEATSAKRLVSVGCQTTVSGDEWVTKASIATDVERVQEIEAVIETALNNTALESLNFSCKAEGVAENIKEETLRWQEDHTSMLTHVNVLKAFREIADRHEADGLTQRELADKLAEAVKDLESRVKHRTKLYEEKLQLREQEQQKRVDALLETVTSLETKLAEYTGTDGKKEASAPDASLGPREAESQSVSANTPELQEDSQATAPVVVKADGKSSNDPMLPSPPLSPPNADGVNPEASGANGKQEASGNEGKPSNKETIITNNSENRVKTNASTGHPFLRAPESLQAPESSPHADGSTVSPVDPVSSASVEGCVELEKTSDSEMDAANGSAGSDNEIMEEKGTGVWSRVQTFEFRSGAPFTKHLSIARQHFTIAEIDKIVAMLIKFRDTVANEEQREQISALLNAGFPYSTSFKYKYKQDLITIFQDIAEVNKIPTKERIFTEFPTYAYAFACGIAPGRMNLSNHRGRTWRQFIEVLLPSTRGRLLHGATPEDKVIIERDIGEFKRVIERFMGDREELWRRVLTAEAVKTNQGWDWNLIARRFLENFGLLEFRQVTTEGTSMEPYIPMFDVPAPVEETAPEDQTSNPTTINETHAPKESACPGTPVPTEVGGHEVPAQKESATNETPTEVAISEPAPIEETPNETPAPIEAAACETPATKEETISKTPVLIEAAPSETPAPIETPDEVSPPVEATPIGPPKDEKLAQIEAIPCEIQQTEVPQLEAKALEEPLPKAPTHQPPSVQPPSCDLPPSQPVNDVNSPAEAVKSNISPLADESSADAAHPSVSPPANGSPITAPEPSTSTTSTTAVNRVDAPADDSQSAIPCAETSQPSPAAKSTSVSPATSTFSLVPPITPRVPSKAAFTFRAPSKLTPEVEVEAEVEADVDPASPSTPTGTKPGLLRPTPPDWRAEALKDPKMAPPPQRAPAGLHRNYRNRASNGKGGNSRNSANSGNSTNSGNSGNSGTNAKGGNGGNRNGRPRNP